MAENTPYESISSTGSMLDDAVTKRHEHANKDNLDSISSTGADIDDAVVNKHEHTNKDILDATEATYTEEEKTLLSSVSANAEPNNMSDGNVSELSNAANTELHFHSTDRNRANHTGQQTANTISNLDDAISGNSSVLGNTAKIEDVNEYLGIPQIETSYYVSDSDGLDTNDGLSPRSPFKTIQKIKLVEPVGDAVYIYLKCGDTFTAELYIADNVKYKPYGYGELPFIKGSIPRNTVEKWVTSGTNKWRTPLQGTIIGGVEFTSTDVGFLFINNNRIFGTKRADKDGLSQILSSTSVSSVVTDGIGIMTVTAKNMENSPITVNVPLTTSQNTSVLVAEEVKKALEGNSDIEALFNMSRVGSGVIITTNAYSGNPNDQTISMVWSDAGTGALFDNAVTIQKGDAGLSYDGDFFVDETNGVYSVDMFCVGNPGDIYDTVEIALEKNIAKIQGFDGVEIDQLGMGLCGGHAVYINDTDRCKITNNRIKYVGGAYLYSTIRYGNGIELWKQNTNSLVADNDVMEIFDAGITVQGTATSSPVYYEQENLLITNNKIRKAHYACELWGRHVGDTSTKMTNINFLENECIESGYGWGAKARVATGEEDTYGSSFIFGSSTAVLKNINISNNTFDKAKDYIYRWKHSDEINDFEKIRVENNSLVQDAGAEFIAYRNYTNYKNDISGWASYKEASGQDKNSSVVLGNPDDTVFPESFGAVASKLVDATKAIQDTIDYCIVNNKKLGFRNKLYRVDGYLSAPNYLPIEGVFSSNFRTDTGANGTVLYSPTPSTKAVLTIYGTPVNRKAFSVKNLVVCGNSSWNSSGSKVERPGIEFKDTSRRGLLENVTIQGFAHEALKLDSVFDADFRTVTITWCGTNNTRAAFHVTANNDVTNACRFFGLHIEHCPYMFYVEKCRHMAFVACKFEMGDKDEIGAVATTTPMRIANFDTFNTQEIAFTKCLFVNDYRNGFHLLQAENNDTEIDGCQFASGSDVGGMYINHLGSYINVHDNTFYYCRGDLYSITLATNAKFINNKIKIKSTASNEKYLCTVISDCLVENNTVICEGTGDTSGVLFNSTGAGNVYKDNKISGDFKLDYTYNANNVYKNFKGESIVGYTDTAIPDVLGIKTIALNHSVATNITDLANGYSGQVVMIVANDSGGTIISGTSIKLSGGANLAMTQYDTLTLLKSATGEWLEVSRSVNA